jgi:hypothetical protein
MILIICTVMLIGQVESRYIWTLKQIKNWNVWIQHCYNVQTVAAICDALSFCCNQRWRGILLCAACQGSGADDDKVPWLYIIICWTVTNWSSLEVVYNAFLDTEIGIKRQPDQTIFFINKPLVDKTVQLINMIQRNCLHLISYLHTLQRLPFLLTV